LDKSVGRFYQALFKAQFSSLSIKLFFKEEMYLLVNLVSSLLPKLSFSKSAFEGGFQGLRAHISTETPSTASDRESAVRNSINMATSKLLCFRSFNEESVSAYLLSPVLGKKASLLTHASQQRQGVFDFVLARFQQSESRTKTFFTNMTNTCR